LRSNSAGLHQRNRLYLSVTLLPRNDSCRYLREAKMLINDSKKVHLRNDPVVILYRVRADCRRSELQLTGLGILRNRSGETMRFAAFVLADTRSRHCARAWACVPDGRRWARGRSSSGPSHDVASEVAIEPHAFCLNTFPLSNFLAALWWRWANFLSCRRH